MIVPSYRSYQANQVETRPSSSCSVLRARYVHMQEKKMNEEIDAHVYTHVLTVRTYTNGKKNAHAHTEN